MKKLYQFCQVLCAVILVFLFVNNTSAQIVVTASNPYSYGFENGLNNWTAEAISGTDTWEESFTAHTGSKSVNYSGSMFGDFLNLGQGGGDDWTVILQLIQMMTQLDNMGNSSARLISPTMDISGLGSQATLRFYRKQSTMMIPQYLYVFYRTSPSGQWTPILEFSNTTEWTEESVTLPSPSATYQISFMGVFNIENMGELDYTAFMDPNAMTNFSSDIFIDDIYIGSSSGTGPSSDCDAPINIASNYITANSANVTWGGPALSWTLEYGPAGFAQGSGVVVTAQNPTYTFTGLSAGTTYDVYIRANCTSGSSTWAQTSFTTSGGNAIAENNNVLSIAPNPTTGVVRCNLNNVNNARLQVLDVYGKLLMEQVVTESTTEIDFSDKASGIYFLRVIDGNSILTTQKVIRR